MTRPVVDAAARGRIVADLDASLVVVAGAGTGKTTALVGRIVELVRSGAASLRDLAVITFTEAAAAELRARVGEAVDAAAAEQPADERLQTARAELDEAAICTLHAFAQRILTEYGVDSGIPPDFDVLDQIAEQADFDAALAHFLDDMLEDPSAEPMLVRGFALGLGQRSLGEVAWAMHLHWDRLQGGALDALAAARPSAADWAAPDPAPLVDALDAALALAGHCTAADDKLLVHLLGRVADARAVLAAADDATVLLLLDRLPTLACGQGQRDNWGGRIAEARDACTAAEQMRQDLLAAAVAPVVAELRYRLAAFTVAHGEQRAAEGRLTFHDLLVHSRRLLREAPAARQALRARYRRLLVDEFQDTDPIQVELAAWLASAVDGAGDLGSARLGALFVVGDPKQSIYRFRRADIALFERVCAEVGEQLVLETNFRSVPGILEFVNTVFAELFSDTPLPGQAAHHPLAAARSSMAPTMRASLGVQLELGLGADHEPEAPVLQLPPVVVLGGPVDGAVADVRRQAARHAADAVTRVVRQGWPVDSPSGPGGVARPARWADIAVLIPARTALPALEEAFDEAGVPFRLEGAALLWGSDDVRDVLCALAAADEPSDAVSVLAALRSPGLGCGDDDLVTWHDAGGSWDPRAEPPPGMAGHPVGRAMAELAELHRQRWWAEPSAMVRLALERLRCFELATAHRRPRDHWQRLRWLADQARAFDETIGGSLHDFLAWAEIQRQGDGRSSTVGAPEPDDDAVRVMTVHGAKGLEFPVVVLAGLERDDSGQRSDAVLWGRGEVPEVRAGTVLRSAGYQQAAEEDRALDRLERVRLLYVATTRARDHLILCLHHKQRAGTDQSHAARLSAICADHPLLWRRLPDPEPDPEQAPKSRGARRRAERADAATLQHAFAAGATAAPPWEEERAAWVERRRAVLVAGRRMPVVTASGLAEADHTGPAATHAGDGAGRGPGADAAADIGRAVHGALAALDLRRGTDARGRAPAEVAAGRAVVHGVGEHSDAVQQMVAAALAAPELRRAAEVRHHQEMYVATGLGADGLLEGFVDLLVEDEDGLVLVDYKTDRLTPDAVEAAAARHRPQLAAYALAVARTSGRPVVRCVLLFLGVTPGTAVRHVLQGAELEAAMADASERALAAVGA